MEKLSPPPPPGCFQTSSGDIKDTIIRLLPEVLVNHFRRQLLLADRPDVLQRRGLALYTLLPLAGHASPGPHRERPAEYERIV